MTRLAPHELLEAHEFLASETTSVQKLQAAINLVQDTELKALLQSCLTAKQRRISSMEQLLSTTISTMQ